MLRTNHEISSFPFLSFLPSFFFFLWVTREDFKAKKFIYLEGGEYFYLGRFFRYSIILDYSQSNSFASIYYIFSERNSEEFHSLQPTNQRLDSLTFVYRHEQGVERKASFTIVTISPHKPFPRGQGTDVADSSPRNPPSPSTAKLFVVKGDFSRTKWSGEEGEEEWKSGKKYGRGEREKKRKKEKGMRIFAVPPSTWLTVPVHSRGFILPTSLPFPRLSFLLLRGDNHTSMSSGIFVAGKPRRGYPKVPHRAITLSSSFVKGASSSSGRQGTGGDRRRDRRMACKERPSSVCVYPCVCVRGLKR